MASRHDENRRDKAVLAVFSDETAVQGVVERLKMQGFTTEDISAIAPKGVSNSTLGIEKESKAPEGATTGATTGAVVGGTLGFLAGVGALAIPGLGPLIAAGPIMATLAGLGAGAAVGGVAGALIGLGIPEYEARKYEDMVKEGNILIAVHADSRELQHRAKEILEDSGGRDIAVVGEKRSGNSKEDRDILKDRSEMGARPVMDASFGREPLAPERGSSTHIPVHHDERSVGDRRMDDRNVPPPI